MSFEVFKESPTEEGNINDSNLILFSTILIISNLLHKTKVVFLRSKAPVFGNVIRDAFVTFRRPNQISRDRVDFCSEFI